MSKIVQVNSFGTPASQHYVQTASCAPTIVESFEERSMDILTPEQEREVNLMLAREFIDTRLGIAISDNSVTELADFIQYLEAKYTQ